MVRKRTPHKLSATYRPICPTMTPLGFLKLGPRSRRRASQPRPGGFASRCSSPKRVVQRPASSPLRASMRSAAFVHPCTAQGSAASGVLLMYRDVRMSGPRMDARLGQTSCLLLFAQAKRSRTPAARKPRVAFQHRRRRFNSVRTALPAKIWIVRDAPDEPPGRTGTGSGTAKAPITSVDNSHLEAVQTCLPVHIYVPLRITPIRIGNGRIINA